MTLAMLFAIGLGVPLPSEPASTLESFSAMAILLRTLQEHQSSFIQCNARRRILTEPVDRSVLKGRVPVLPVDARVAELYARVQAACSRIGRPRPAFDLLIAATALVHGLILATCNARHFAGIEDLSVEDWSRDHP